MVNLAQECASPPTSQWYRTGQLPLSFFLQDGTAVNVSDDAELYFAFVPLSYLNCTRSREVANLPVCEIRFANLSDQCAVGRTGNANTTHTQRCTPTQSSLSSFNRHTLWNM